MSSNHVQLLVCDMAGTTVRDQSEVEHCFYRAAVDTGLPGDKDRIKAMQGLPKLIVVETLWAEQIGQGHPTFRERVNQTYDHFREVLENHYLTEAVLPTDGALETLAALRARGIKVALTTGFYRQVANIILDRLGWRQGLDEQYRAVDDSALIDLSLTPDETGKGRPHPDMILHAMRVFGITDPRLVVKIGDTPADLEAGAAAGVGLNLAVTNGTHSRAQLAAYPNDGLLPGISALPAAIEAYEKQRIQTA